MQYIGKIDINKISKYGKIIITDNVILTDERKLHIYQKHYKDFDKIMKNIVSVVTNPSEIIEDMKNRDTLFFIGKLEKNNLNVVVKLNTTHNVKHYQNSIMTAWIIRDKNLKKLREKNKTIYNSEYKCYN